MSPKPATALRQRLLEDMAVRHFGEKSKHDYLRHIDQFLAFLLAGLRRRRRRTTCAISRSTFTKTACALAPSTAQFRPCAFSFARRLVSRILVINWPACITRASCRACFLPKT